MILEQVDIDGVEPFGYYVLLSLLENELIPNDEWTKKGEFFLPKESLGFDHAYCARIIKIGSLCREKIKVGDIVRMCKVYGREELRDKNNKRYFITKESNCIGLFTDEEDHTEHEN
jgi:co-chaperonin GroES (HSP10)